MKNSTKTTLGILAIAITFICAPIQAATTIDSNNIQDNGIILPMGGNDDLIGGWEYTVVGGAKGLIMIVNQNGVFKVQVQMNANSAMGNKIAVKGNKITFEVELEGETVAFALEAKGSKLSGTLTSSKSVLNVTGIKSISPQ